MSSEPALTATAAPDDNRPTKLQRGITGPLLFVLILGDVLGAGVYALTGELSAEVGGVLRLPLLLALLTAGSYAELVTKHPRAGGARSSRSGPSAAPSCRSSSASACSRPAW